MAASPRAEETARLWRSGRIRGMDEILSSAPGEESAASLHACECPSIQVANIGAPGPLWRLTEGF